MAHKTLLCIHGFRGGPAGFTDICKYLPKDWQIERPIIPPSGKNSLSEYDLDRYVEFIVQYIKKHKLQKPILVGHSMGSIIAAAVAARHPELVNRKIIFLAPITKSVAGWIRALSTLIVCAPNRFVSYATNTYLFAKPRNRQLRRQILKVAATDAQHYTSKKDVMKAAKFSCSHTSSEHELPQELCVIAGAQDKITNITAIQEFAEKQRAELHILRQAGHLLNYEAPEATAKIMIDFLNQ